MLSAMMLIAAASVAGPRPMFTEAKGSPFAVGPQAGRLVSGDVNGDGCADIVLACGACCGQAPKEDAGHVAVLINDGKGSFSQASSPLKIGPTALRVALADLNGDSKLDIACIEHGTYDVHLLMGDGKGGFTKAGSVRSREGTHPHSHDIAAGDLNGDGRVDLAVTNADDNTISVLLNKGDAAFKAAEGSPFAAGRHPYEGLSIADFNGDQKPDLAVTNVQGNCCAVLTNDGQAGFTMGKGSLYEVGERPGFLACGDLNGDRRPDVLVSHDDVGLVHSFVCGKDGELRKPPGSPFKMEERVWGMAIADVDRDGVQDAVLAGIKGNIHILRTDAQGNLSMGYCSPLKAGEEPCYVIVADFNNDRKLDIAASNYKGGSVSVFLAD